MIPIKGSHFPKHIGVYAVWLNLRYSGSLQDLEEILVERGIAVDHANLKR